MNFISAQQATTTIITTKRKFEQEDQCQQQQQKERNQFIHIKNNSYQLKNEITTYSILSNKPYQLSANATANRANTPAIMDTVMLEDDFTDEDDVLKTPSNNNVTTFIPYNITEDLDQGGFTGTLELGSNEYQ